MLAAPYIDTQLRHEEEILKAYISNLKYTGAGELVRQLKEKEKELSRLIDEEKHLKGLW